MNNQTEVVSFSNLQIKENGGICAISHKKGKLLSVMAAGRSFCAWNLHLDDIKHVEALLSEAISNSQPTKRGE
jgi:hypothetical protein